MSIYTDHKHAVKMLNKYKAKELAIRKEIVETLAKDETAGTYTFMEDGYQIKIVKSYNYSLDRDLLESIYDDLPEEQQALLDFKPSLKIADYKATIFTDEIDAVIIVKDALPKVTVL